MDENGFLGRSCPVDACLGYFKVKPGTGLTGSELKCHCPYCGHVGDPNTFWTPEQIEYAQSIALRQVAGALQQDLKQFEFNHSARGAFGIGLSMKVENGPLPPVRQYREKKLETDVVCSKCTLHYSVFGLFAYCPDCRVHNSLQILEGNLSLVDKQLALAATLDSAELSRHLVEDALENCVSAFDGFARETCRVRAATASDPDKASKLSFQSLGGASAGLKKLFSVDFEASVDHELWAIARRGFSKRHLLAHRAGIVDEKYVIETNDPNAIPGRRIGVTPIEVADLQRAVLAIGTALLGVLPPT